MAYDGPQIFLAPYGNDAAYENFTRTVNQGVSAEEVRPYTDFDVETEPVRLWGTKETVEGTWSSIDAGDFLFFYRNGTYQWATEVLGTETNEALGKEIWPNYEEGKPWSCIIYLKEPAELGVDSSEIHGLAGYDRDFPMGFAPLNDMGVGGVRGKYGSVESLVYGENGKEQRIDTTESVEVSLPASVLDHLFFPDSADSSAEDIVDQAAAALNAGKHIIFTGPPGTGKTEIAQQIARYLSEQHPEVFTGHQTTTATADWSTFDTVGGYMPEGNGGDSLEFKPGQILRSFKRNGTQRNDLLIIDEINRSDIDKSFGQLFTLLSGQEIQLPFTTDGEAVEVYPAETAPSTLDAHEYVVPSSWRLLATMNSYDKTSLYEMSYAFMRRFSFIHIDAPEVPTDEAERRHLLEQYLDVWEQDVEPDVIDAVGDIWHITNTVVDHRKVGPAIVKDMLGQISNSSAPLERAVTRAITSYVFPQLEGVQRRKQIVTQLAAAENVDSDRLGTLAEDILRVEIDG
jgi:MoxR-like ATPase